MTDFEIHHDWRINASATLKDAFDAMQSKKASALIVEDDKGQFLHLITEANIVDMIVDLSYKDNGSQLSPKEQLSINQLIDFLKEKDTLVRPLFMTRNELTKIDICAVAHAMCELKWHHIVVLENDPSKNQTFVVGVLSCLEVLNSFLPALPTKSSFNSELSESINGIVAAQSFSEENSNFLFVNPLDSVARVAEQFTNTGAPLAFVKKPGVTVTATSKNIPVIGVLTLSDIVRRCFARSKSWECLSSPVSKYMAKDGDRQPSILFLNNNPAKKIENPSYIRSDTVLQGINFMISKKIRNLPVGHLHLQTKRRFLGKFPRFHVSGLMNTLSLLKIICSSMYVRDSAREQYAQSFVRELQKRQALTNLLAYPVTDVPLEPYERPVRVKFDDKKNVVHEAPEFPHESTSSEGQPSVHKKDPNSVAVALSFEEEPVANVKYVDFHSAHWSRIILCIKHINDIKQLANSRSQADNKAAFAIGEKLETVLEEMEAVCAPEIASEATALDETTIMSAPVASVKRYMESLRRLIVVYTLISEGWSSVSRSAEYLMQSGDISKGTCRAVQYLQKSLIKRAKAVTSIESLYQLIGARSSCLLQLEHGQSVLLEDPELLEKYIVTYDSIVALSYSETEKPENDDSPDSVQLTIPPQFDMEARLLMKVRTISTAFCMDIIKLITSRGMVYCHSAYTVDNIRLLAESAKTLTESICTFHPVAVLGDLRSVIEDDQSDVRFDHAFALLMELRAALEIVSSASRVPFENFPSPVLGSSNAGSPNIVYSTEQLQLCFDPTAIAKHILSVPALKMTNSMDSYAITLATFAVSSCQALTRSRMFLKSLRQCISRLDNPFVQEEDVEDFKQKVVGTKSPAIEHSPIWDKPVPTTTATSAAMTILHLMKINVPVFHEILSANYPASVNTQVFSSQLASKFQFSEYPKVISHDSIQTALDSARLVAHHTYVDGQFESVTNYVANDSIICLMNAMISFCVVITEFIRGYRLTNNFHAQLQSSPASQVDLAVEVGTCIGTIMSATDMLKNNKLTIDKIIERADPDAKGPAFTQDEGTPRSAAINNALRIQIGAMRSNLANVDMLWQIAKVLSSSSEPFLKSLRDSVVQKNGTSSSASTTSTAGALAQHKLSLTDADSKQAVLSGLDALQALLSPPSASL